MTLGKPKNIDNFICVTSDISLSLHKLGFIPMYREVGFDKIYFLKSEEIIGELLKIKNDGTIIKIPVTDGEN